MQHARHVTSGCRLLLFQFSCYALVYICRVGSELDCCQCQSSGARAGTFINFFTNFFRFCFRILVLLISLRRVSVYRRLLSFRLVSAFNRFYAAVAAWSTIYSLDVHKLIIICARRCEAAPTTAGRKCLPAGMFEMLKGKSTWTSAWAVQ